MAIRGGAKQTKEIQLKIQDLLAHVRQHMAKTQEYILATGKGLLSHYKVVLRTKTNIIRRPRRHVRHTRLERAIGK